MGKLPFGYMRAGCIPMIVAFALMLLLSPLVFAGWVEDSYSGDWIAKNRAYWGADGGDGFGDMYWSYDEYVFEGYEASINFTQFSSYRNWWDYQDNKKVVLLWNFSNIYVYVNFLEQHNLFGWIQDRWVQVATSENSTAFTASADFWWNPFAIQTERDDFLNFPSYVKVYMDKISATEVQIVILNCRVDTTDNVLLWDETYSVSADWFANNNMTFSVMHSGYGSFFGGMSDSIHTSPFSPDYGDTEDIQGFGIWDFIDNLLGGALRVLPSWLQDQVAMLGGWFGWLISAVPFFSQFIGMVLPILPYFLLFWILDAVASCVLTGNISPLGVCFSTILHLGSSVVGVLVTIMGTIYDFIHFW